MKEAERRAMPPPRRRHHPGRCQTLGASALSILSFATLVVLIFLAFLSYLAPPLLDHRPLSGARLRGVSNPPSHLTVRNPRLLFLFPFLSSYLSSKKVGEKFLISSRGSYLARHFNRSPKFLGMHHLGRVQPVHKLLVFRFNILFLLMIVVIPSYSKEIM